MERRVARIGAQRAETVMPSAAERSGVAARRQVQTEQQIVVPWPLRGPLRTCPDTHKLRLTGFVVAKRFARIVYPL